MVRFGAACARAERSKRELKKGAATTAPPRPRKKIRRFNGRIGAPRSGFEQVESARIVNGGGHGAFAAAEVLGQVGISEVSDFVGRAVFEGETGFVCLQPH